MTPEQYRRIEDIFGEAFQSSDDHRLAVVAACEDTEVREVVEELLRDAAASRFLAQGLEAARTQPVAPPSRVASRGIAAVERAPTLDEPDDLDVEDLDVDPSASHVGSTFGSFEVLEDLDGAGDGHAFRALRRVGSVKRAALIKVYPCSDALERLARFERDRLILSAIEHPNLARFLEAGVRPDGVFLAWEYTGADRLADGSMGLRTTLRARLSGFLEIARAVEFLHFHLVAHGDIRVENIGIDASGRCKLLCAGETILNARGRGATYTVADDIHQLGDILNRLAGPGRHLPAGLARIAATASNPDPSKCYPSVSQMIAAVESWSHRSPNMSETRWLRWVLWALGLGVLVAAVIWAVARFGGSF